MIVTNDLIKKRIIEFYKRKKKYDWLEISPKELGFTDKFDKIEASMNGDSIRRELVKENKLRVIDDENQYFLEYVKPPFDYARWTFIASLVSITIAVIALIRLFNKS